MVVLPQRLAGTTVGVVVAVGGPVGAVGVPVMAVRHTFTAALAVVAVVEMAAVVGPTVAAGVHPRILRQRLPTPIAPHVRGRRDAT